ncbi:MAG: hypothetical protein KJO55_09330 [Gammaproteobacteria bacterium]|nr:hypothetical protein [Gammaproteobacteria bacterium]NND60669.1 hypothetical protein [Gammaproteobacteria bacterium]
MLREIKKISQDPEGPRRRWFTDQQQDLVIWHEDGEITSFELCYGKGSEERALRWSATAGLEQYVVDDGEGRCMRHKMSPMLENDRWTDFDDVRQEFTRAARGIDAGITAFVYRRLSFR